MFKKFMALLLALCMLASFAACGAEKPAEDNNVAMQYIKAEEAKELLNSDEYVFFDIRKAADSSANSIPGAFAWDMDAAKEGNAEAGKATMTEATKELDKKIILVCYSGKRYAQAATNALSAIGYDMTKVFTLEGGFTNWSEVYPELTTNPAAAETEAPVADDHKGGTFVYAIAKAPETFNPNAKINDLAKPVLHNVFNQLVKINGNDQVVLDIAKDWEYSADGMELTFYLQENVKWHDGEPFTSYDVKWTFDEIIAKAGLASDSLVNVTEITCPDDNTVTFHLSAPDATLVSALAWNGTFIMPAHIYEGTDWLTNPANDAPIGTGPFKFVSYTDNQTIVLERFDEYWGTKAQLDKVILTVIEDSNTAYQAWLNDEIDDMDHGVPASEQAQLMADENYVVYTKMWPNRSYICFQTKEGPFADVRVREAIILGLDRDAIFEKGFKSLGMKAEYYVSPLYTWAVNENAKIPAYNPERANELLDEAGLTRNADGIRFETTIDTFGGYDEALQVIVSNFKDLGIILTVNTMDDPSYDEKVWFGHNFDLTILGGYQGPDISMMSQRFVTDAGINLGEYSNAELDALFAEDAVTGDLERRAEIYARIQEILAEDMPVAFLREMGSLIFTKAYVMGHPKSPEFIDSAAGYEFVNIWLNK